MCRCTHWFKAMKYQELVLKVLTEYRTGYNQQNKQRGLPQNHGLTVLDWSMLRCRNVVQRQQRSYYFRCPPGYSAESRKKKTTWAVKTWWIIVTRLPPCDSLLRRAFKESSQSKIRTTNFTNDSECWPSRTNRNGWRVCIGSRNSDESCVERRYLGRNSSWHFDLNGISSKALHLPYIHRF